MEGLTKYALAVTSISPSVTRAPAFLAASTVAPTTHAVVLGPSSPRSRLPVLALTRPSDDSKPNESRFIQTKSLRAPRGTTVAPEGCAHLGVPFEFTQDQGLLCLERTIPDEISQSLGRLVEEVAPFKVEVFRGSLGANGRWLDTLIQPFLAGSSSGSFVGEPSRQHSRTRVKRNGPSPDLYSELADDIDVAVRWLTADIDSVARLFAREVANSSTPWPGLTVAAKEGGEIDLTVKLELLKKGKCPRYHLDRVPLRLICTYFGPSTEWLDGYDVWEMHNSRSPPPVCNQEISGGLEVRRAGEGDVLIFRGQPPQSTGPIGVAHRSPDMEEGQRRLVLTIDIGDITWASGSS